jgi:undecaprenyl diphosphate synthase
LLEAIDDVEAATRHGKTLLLRLAVDYSGRQAILEAARRYLAAAGPTQPLPGTATSEDVWLNDERIAEFGRSVSDQRSAHTSVSCVDLIIRTGGEQRLSDFLIWEAAYAELYFTDVMWPDFTTATLEIAMRSFWARDRRFGKASSSQPGAPASSVLTAVASSQ